MKFFTLTALALMLAGCGTWQAELKLSKEASKDVGANADTKQECYKQRTYGKCS